MKICFALLVDYEVNNYTRRMAFDINRKYQTGVLASRLPQHVTLGPGIEVDSPEEVGSYFSTLARSIEPFEIHFPRVSLKIVEHIDLGVIWLDVNENSELRRLHDKIYKEVLEHGWKADVLFGGEEYQFHSTIVLGGQPPEVYRKIYKEIEPKAINLRCTVREIALMCPPDNDNKMGTYITYRILPLGERD